MCRAQQGGADVRTQEEPMKMLIALTLLLTACATPVYEHPSKGQRELDADWYACEERFAELVSRDPGYGAYMRERCLASKGWRPSR